MVLDGKLSFFTCGQCTRIVRRANIFFGLLIRSIQHSESHGSKFIRFAIVAADFASMRPVLECSGVNWAGAAQSRTTCRTIGCGINFLSGVFTELSQDIHLLSPIANSVTYSNFLLFLQGDISTTTFSTKFPAKNWAPCRLARVFLSPRSHPVDLPTKPTQLCPIPVSVPYRMG